MSRIWTLDRSGSDGSAYDSRFSSSERDLAGVDMSDWEEASKFNREKKTHFYSREEAEIYALPIAQNAFGYFISDMIANNKRDYDGDEEEYEYAQEEEEEYKRRGLVEIRCEVLVKGDEHYDCYHYDYPRTSYVCPVAHEDDRIGFYFASISCSEVH